jgi:hypothetical protein
MDGSKRQDMHGVEGLPIKDRHFKEEGAVLGFHGVWVLCASQTGCCE